MKKARLSPRKKPSQARSLEMTQNIIGATTRILSAHGFDGLTTNLVAAEAKISIGSFYQYFPNKESLIFAIASQMLTEDRAQFESIKKAIRNKKDTELALRETLSLFLNIHAKDNRLRAEIYHLIFKLGATKEVFQLREEITSIFQDFLVLMHPQADRDVLKAKAFLLFHASMGVMQGISNSKEIPDLTFIENFLLGMFLQKL